MQIAFAVIASKTRWHRQPLEKQPPQDRGSRPEPGALSASLYSPETSRGDILSATQMSTNFKFSIRATRPVQAYLELHKRLRSAFVLAAFLVASFALYLVVAIWFIGAPGTIRNFSADFVLPLSCLLFAIICDLGIASALHQPTLRTFWSTLTLASGAIIVGAILVSLAVWRSHWFEMFRWIFQPS